MQRMIRSRHNPLTHHLGIPGKPQIASRAATTARIRIVTAHDNIVFKTLWLKACQDRRSNLSGLAPIGYDLEYSLNHFFKHAVCKPPRA
jgi:hypothetical protein